MPRVRACLLAAIASALPACKSDRETPEDKPASVETAPAEPAVPAPPPSATQSDPQTVAAKLLVWLDPEAMAVVFSQLPDDLDPDALAIVFALPPKVERLVGDAADIDEALDAVLPPDAPRPSTWLGPQSLAMVPLVAAGTYVVRPLVKPPDEVKALLQAADMRPTETEGITIYVPEGIFPWKVAFLTDDVVAFIPVKEIGTGLGPLTAGRDLPPSDAEQQLAKVLTDDPKTVLELYAAGPLLHLDLGQDIDQLTMRIKPWDGGLDVDVRMLPTEDPSRAATSLEQRDLALEPERIRRLADNVAFTVDGPAVTGRLQLTADDLQALREAS